MTAVENCRWEAGCWQAKRGICLSPALCARTVHPAALRRTSLYGRFPEERRLSPFERFQRGPLPPPAGTYGVLANVEAVSKSPDLFWLVDAV